MNLSRIGSVFVGSLQQTVVGMSAIRHRFDMDYRYRVLGARGQLSLRDDVVSCETATMAGSWSHETPYRCIKPNAVRTTVVSPSVGWIVLPFAIAALLGFIVSVKAILGRVAAPQETLFVSVAALVVGVVGCVVAKRRCMVEWVIFPTTLTGHRIAFMRYGPDAEKYDDFIEALHERINSHNQTG